MYGGIPTINGLAILRQRDNETTRHVIGSAKPQCGAKVLPVTRPARPGDGERSYGHVQFLQCPSLSASYEQLHIGHVLGHESEPFPVHVEAAEEPPTAFRWDPFRRRRKPFGTSVAAGFFGLTIEYPTAVTEMSATTQTIPNELPSARMPRGRSSKLLH